ncbi:DUF4111 domain-containing protein (plasmid) [Paracoccus sp. MA]|uniref:aminoglycoside adenylyltransferase domain-containing protein n=1 Tax=Paracoccus sp. MA TaxID=2895796 RepID=UPI001E437647|nr:aminoglycoside adenylyltransferase domain-containing protein [Paracoccus sp. MA]UFM66941.1 DUF4111 domain-containing protein [Paracoccus sp. MA]
MQTVPRQFEQIPAALATLRNILGDALLAAYLHGSTASGQHRPQSDIDLLAVVDRALSEGQRSDLLAALLRLSGRHPAAPGGPRCLEVMIFRRADLAEPASWGRAEFVYGEWLREAFESGSKAMPARDPEHILLLAQAREEAIPLFGPGADQLLPAFPPARLRQAMRDMLPALLAGLHGDERNVLLTLARMWHTASTGQFASKQAAALWAKRRIRGWEAATLDHARQAHLGEIADDWSSRSDAAQRLAAHLERQIAGELGVSEGS